MQIRALSVTELNQYIKRIMDYDPILNQVTLKGEISNFKLHGSGHAYFSLKDDTSKINCVMFKSFIQNVKFFMDNGLKVIAKGNVSVFERNGQYQMYIQDLQPDGIGALTLAYEQLKEKLIKEGLFDLSKKKKIPSFPKKIAVVTSLTGAAIQDILSVIKRRNQYVNIIIFPTLVQGEQASYEICEAIDTINHQYEDIDVIIMGRGGGSIEELWAFNEERVARKIATSRIPIVSAVGHETDYTICDFVADLRAPTPSAAAELVAPSIVDIKNNLEKFHNQLKHLLLTNIKEHRKKLSFMNESKLETYLNHKIYTEKKDLQTLKKDMDDHIRRKIEGYQLNLIGAVSKLEALSPLSTVSRGYGLVYKNKNHIIDSIDSVEKNTDIHILLTDGTLSCKVMDKKKEDLNFEYFKTTRE